MGDLLWPAHQPFPMVGKLITYAIDFGDGDDALENGDVGVAIRPPLARLSIRGLDFPPGALPTTLPPCFFSAASDATLLDPPE